MTKKRLEVTIDEELLEKAKKQIPNISSFVEECLKNYLGVGNNLTPTFKMHDLVETISKSQLELFLMNEKKHLEETQQKREQQEIDYAWRQLFTEYRDTRTINQSKLEKASEVLGVSCKELVDIVEVCFIFSRDDKVDVTDWKTVYTQYGYGDD